MKHSLSLVAALLVVCCSTRWSSALPTTDLPASLLVFPYVRVDTAAGIDTVIEVTNVSNSVASLQCFLEDTTPHCEPSGSFCESVGDCPQGEVCQPSWGVTKFSVTLTLQQPLGWRAGAGRAQLPLAGNAGTIPAVPSDPFLGAMRCIQVDDAAVPVAGNSFIGNARLETVADGLVVDAASYNAFGFVGGDSANADGELVLGEGAEYSGAANVNIVHFLFDGAVDPLRPDGTVQSTLVLLPVSADYVTPAPAQSVVQFLVRTEVPNAFSTSVSLDGQLVRRLVRIDSPDPTRSSFSAARAGTMSGQMRMSMPGKSGAVALLIERRFDGAGNLVATAFRPAVGTGVRATPDRVVIAAVPPTPTPVPSCPGDCDGNHAVTEEEFGLCASISIGGNGLGQCIACDVDANGSVSVDEVVQARVSNIQGCPGFELPTPTTTSSPTASPSATATPSPTASGTATPSPTATSSPTRTTTAVPSATSVPTSSPTLTSTTVPSTTPTPTFAPTLTATAVPTQSPSPIVTEVATPTLTPAAPTCSGDCDGNNQVTVDEIVRGVGIALGTLPASACGPFDVNGDHLVTVDEIVRAVGVALSGCATGGAS